MNNGLSLCVDGQIPLLTVQEEATRDAPRIYRPHAAQTKPRFDWDALTPTCKDCGTKTGQVSTINGLCPPCDPTPQTVVPEPTTPVKERQTRAKTPTSPQPRKQLRGRPRRALDIDAIIAAYTGGQTISSIAIALNTSAPPVKQVLLDAGIELRNDLNRPRAKKPCEHGNLKQSCSACREARLAKRRSGRPPGRPRGVANTRNPIDEQAAIADYIAGASAPEVAYKYRCTPARIRNLLDRHEIERRDDRTTRSGRTLKDYDPTLVARVRQLYLEHQLSQTQVAGRLGITVKVVYNIMRRHQVPGRTGQSGRMDGAAGLKTQMRDLGLTARQVKTWANSQGLLDIIGPGLPSQRLVDAYLDAHPQVGVAS